MTLHTDRATGAAPLPEGLSPLPAAHAAEIACDAPCPRARAQSRLVADICVDPMARLALAVARYVGGARATGETDCIEAAFVEAEAALAPAEAGLLVGAIAGLVRALEAEAGRPLALLPASCCRATPDEARLAGLVAAHRRGLGGPPDGRVARVAAAIATLLGPEERA